MNVSKIINTTSSLAIKATETPVFIIPYFHQLDLLDFGVKSVNGHQVTLGWTINEDSTVKEFSVERMDEKTLIFSTIGNFAPNNIHSINPNYLFTDSLAKDGFNHYRLKINLNSFGYIYSNIDKTYIGSLVSYPNPFTSLINVLGLSEGKNHTLKVFSMDGSLVKLANASGNMYQWNLSSLANGVYTLIVDYGTSQEHIRINKMPIH